MKGKHMEGSGTTQNGTGVVPLDSKSTKDKAPSASWPKPCPVGEIPPAALAEIDIVKSVPRSKGTVRVYRHASKWHPPLGAPRPTLLNWYECTPSAIEIVTPMSS
jgi:hypothetical protein